MTDVQVIIATHDRPRMLEVALHSILASAAMVPDTVRVLVIDDASETLEAEDVADRLGVDYMRNDRNLGVGATLALGYERTDSEYSLFWGDDDFMLPRFFPLHLAAIREGHDVVTSGYWLTDADLRPIRELRFQPVIFRDLMRGVVNGTDQSLFRRSSLPPWRPERERAMLLTMWLALTSAGKDIVTLREPTWLYRRHSAQLSHTRPNAHDQALRDAAIAEYRVVA